MNEKKGLFSYENKMVLVVALAFAFVMFDRFAVMNMAPFILPDLGMDNSQFGLVVSSFAFTWAIVGFLACFWSDMRGTKKKILATFILCFSVCSLLTGFAAGFVSLLIIRLIMGIFEGPILPLNQSFLLAQSTPSRRGLNMGIMCTTSVGLISSLLGPIIVVALAQSVGWRNTFFLTIIPGIIVAFLVMKVLIEPDMSAIDSTTVKGDMKGSFKEVMKNRNIIVCLIYSIFMLGWYVVMASFAPLFLTNAKGLDPTTMSLVMSALGVGGIVWGMVVPALSDKYGRKPILIIFSLLSTATPLGFLLVPADNVPLMMFFGFLGWCGAGCIAVFEGPVPTESINPKFASTAVGTIQGFGEIAGGSLGAAIAGFMADKYGLAAPMWQSAGSMVIGTIVICFIYETAPVVLEKRKAKQAAAS
jgi:predicted MFS family arabinose efflux permease